MDQILTSGIIQSLADGDLMGLAKFIAIFVFIWLQIKGLKTEVRNLSTNIAGSFETGEKRFNKLEENQLTFEHRLTMLEQQPKG